jgi:hypothetical protein
LAIGIVEEVHTYTHFFPTHQTPNTKHQTPNITTPHTTTNKHIFRSVVFVLDRQRIYTPLPVRSTFVEKPILTLLLLLLFLQSIIPFISFLSLQRSCGTFTNLLGVVAVALQEAVTTIMRLRIGMETR